MKNAIMGALVAVVAMTVLWYATAKRNPTSPAQYFDGITADIRRLDRYLYSHSQTTMDMNMAQGRIDDYIDRAETRFIKFMFREDKCDPVVLMNDFGRLHGFLQEHIYARSWEGTGTATSFYRSREKDNIRLQWMEKWSLEGEAAEMWSMVSEAYGTMNDGIEYAGYEGKDDFRMWNGHAYVGDLHIWTRPRWCEQVDGKLRIKFVIEAVDDTEGHSLVVHEATIYNRMITDDKFIGDDFYYYDKIKE